MRRQGILPRCPLVLSLDSRLAALSAFRYLLPVSPPRLAVFPAPPQPFAASQGGCRWNFASPGWPDKFRRRDTHIMATRRFGARRQKLERPALWRSAIRIPHVSGTTTRGRGRSAGSGLGGRRQRATSRCVQESASRGGISLGHEQAAGSPRTQTSCRIWIPPRPSDGRRRRLTSPPPLFQTSQVGEDDKN